MAVHIALNVAEGDGLRGGQHVVEVPQGFQLPLLALHRHKELLDGLQRQLVAFGEDADEDGHELAAHLDDHVGQGGRDEADLGGRRQVDLGRRKLRISVAQYFF